MKTELSPTFKLFIEDVTNGYLLMGIYLSYYKHSEDSDFR